MAAGKYDDLGAVPVPTKQSDYADLGAVPVTPAADYSDLGAVPVSPPLQPPEPTIPKQEGRLTDTQVEEIGKRYGLSPEETTELKDAKAFLGQTGGDLTLSNLAKEFAGVASETFALGIPQFIYKKIQSNPKMRAAIDEMNQRIEEQKSVLQKGTELIGGLGGALKLSKLAQGLSKAGKIGQAAAKTYDPLTAITSGAAIGLAESKEGEEGKAAATGAALGAALGVGVPALVKSYKAVRGVSNDILEKAVRQLETEGPQIDRAIEAVVKERKPQIDTLVELAKTKPDAIVSYKEFKKSIPNEIKEKLVTKEEVDRFLLKGGKTAIKAIDDATDTQRARAAAIVAYSKIKQAMAGAEKLTGIAYRDMVAQGNKFAAESLEKGIRLNIAKDIVPGIAAKSRLKEFNALQKAALFFSDGKFVSKIFDEKLGLTGANSMEQILDTASQKLNLYVSALKPGLERSAQLAKMLRKKGLSNKAVYEDIATGTPKTDVAKAYANFFEDMRQEAVAAGLDIGKVEGYVPKIRLPMQEYRAVYKEMVDSNKSDIVKLSPADISFLRNKPDNKLGELLRETEVLTGTDIKTADDFIYQSNQLLKGGVEVTAGVNTKSSRAQQRTKIGIPEWALDTDMGRLSTRWAQETFSYLAERDAIRDLKAYATIAQKAGNPYIAKYVRDVVSDQLGRRTGTLNSLVRKTTEQLQTSLIKKRNESTGLTKRLYDGALFASEMLGPMQQQLYPNYLGMNPKSTLQNMTSFLFQNTPELGASIGPKATVEGMLDMAKYIKGGGSLAKLVEEKGILPTQWTAEMVDAIQNGAKSGPVRDVSKKVLDASTNALMWTFTKAEIIARAQTHFTAKRVAKVAMEDPSVLKELTNRISSQSYRNIFNKAVSDKNLPLLEEAVDRYMQSTNMFNYNRLNMSNYGRFMGPLFSIFSKWPTSVAGKLAHYYINGPASAKEGTVRAMQALVIPFATMELVDRLIAPEQGDSDIYDRFVGSKGLSGWTMLDAIPRDISIQDGLLASPGIKAVTGGVEALQKEDTAEGLAKWMKSLGRSFVPGAGWVRVLAEDIPLYVTGEKVEKD